MEVFRGIGLVLRTPRLWGYCVGPLLLALFVYIGLGVLGGYLLLPHLSAWLSALPEKPLFLSLAGGIALVIWLFLFPFLFVLLGGVFFGFIFEPLSLAVEREVRPGQTIPEYRVPLLTGLRDASGRLACNIGLGFCAFLLGLIPVVGPLLGILVAGCIGVLDYTAPAYARRGIFLSRQAKSLFSPPTVCVSTFIVWAGLLSLVPFVGVLLLPGLVAGGTLLAIKLEDGTKG